MLQRSDLPAAEDTHAIFCVILGIEGHNKTLDIQLGKITLVQGGCMKCLEESFTALMVQNSQVRELINRAGRRANEIRRDERERRNNQQN